VEAASEPSLRSVFQILHRESSRDWIKFPQKLD
jgi:hypothetical protein